MHIISQKKKVKVQNAIKFHKQINLLFKLYIFYTIKCNAHCNINDLCSLLHFFFAIKIFKFIIVFSIV